MAVRATAAKAASDEPIQLAHQAADIVREMIRRGELLPGEKVRQVEVAKSAGVSRSPLREALRTLEGEGLVKYETNRGYVVHRLRMEELGETYELRVLIETELMKHLVQPSKATLSRMADLLKSIESAVETRDFNLLTTSYREFHEDLFRHCGRPVFLREVQRLWKMTDSYNAAHALPANTGQRIVGDHREIMRSLRAGDLDRVREVSAGLWQVNEQVIVGFPKAR